MKATVIKSDDDYVEHEDCHAYVSTLGDVTILNNAGDTVAEYFKHGWKSVTTFA